MWRYWSTCQIQERHPTIVSFIAILLLLLDPSPSSAIALSLDAGSKSVISYNTDVAVVVAEADTEEAYRKYLGTTELTPSLFSSSFSLSCLYPYPHAPHYYQLPGREDEAINKTFEGGKLRTT